MSRRSPQPNEGGKPSLQALRKDFRRDYLVIHNYSMELVHMEGRALPALRSSPGVEGARPPTATTERGPPPTKSSVLLVSAKKNGISFKIVEQRV